MDPRVVIEYKPETNIGEIYYRGTKICDIQLIEINTKIINKSMKKRDMLLDK